MANRRKKRNDGKKFEAKVSDAVRKLYPYAVVRDDVKIPATITGGKRQIDTLVDTGSLVIDFDAKDHRRNIGISDIAEYGFKLEDEDVPLGMMVSNSPYADSAIKAANHFGIKPMHLIDTSDSENQFGIASNTLITVRSIRSLAFGVKHASIGKFSVYQDLGRQLLVSDDEKSEATAYEIFQDILWNSGFLYEEKAKDGTYKDGHYRYTLPKQQIVMADGERGIVDEFYFDYEVRTTYLEGKWSVKSAKGLYDAAKKTFITNEDVESESLTIEEIQAWPQVSVESLDEKKYGIKIDVIGELPDEPDDK